MPHRVYAGRPEQQGAERLVESEGMTESVRSWCTEVPATFGNMCVAQEVMFETAAKRPKRLPVVPNPCRG
jgi:hypothetical protein